MLRLGVCNRRALLPSPSTAVWELDLRNLLVLKNQQISQWSQTSGALNCAKCPTCEALVLVMSQTSDFWTYVKMAWYG